MLLVLQIGLFFMGVWLMCHKVWRWGDRQFVAPFTIFAGLILALQLPLSAGVGVAVGGAQGIRAIREGQDPMTAEKAMLQFWWLDLAVTGGAVMLAGFVALLGLRERILLPCLPDEPIGVTDFRTLQDQNWEYKTREVNSGGTR